MIGQTCRCVDVDDFQNKSFVTGYIVALMYLYLLYTHICRCMCHASTWGWHHSELWQCYLTLPWSTVCSYRPWSSLGNVLCWSTTSGHRQVPLKHKHPEPHLSDHLRRGVQFTHDETWITCMFTQTRFSCFRLSHHLTPVCHSTPVGDRWTDFKHCWGLQRL